MSTPGMPLLSVAMCTYNGGEHLSEQLDSIARQQRSPDELVVCDDRSSDDSASIVQAFARRAPFPVRLEVNERRLGTAANFGRAIGLAGGEIIALCDHDDVWLPDKLRRLEAALAERPAAGMAFSDAELVDASLRPVGWTAWQATGFGPAEQRLLTRGKAVRLLSQRFVVTGATLAFRARFRRLLLPVPEDLVLLDGRPLYHDAWIALALGAVADIVAVPASLVRYRLHARQQLGFAVPADGPATAGAVAPRGPGRPRGPLLGAQGRREAGDRAIAQLTRISSRLAASPGLVDRDREEAVRSRLRHLRARASIPPARAGRVVPVLRELASLRYHRHSSGLRSAAKDLALTPDALDPDVGRAR